MREIDELSRNSEAETASETEKSFIANFFGSLQGFVTIILIVTALVAIPVFLTGEPAEETVERLPGVLESAIGQHEDFAKLGLAASIASGVAALLSFIYSWLKPAASFGRLISIGTLALSLVTVGMMGWTAKLGGVIRHTEISAAGPPSTQPEADIKRGRSQDKDDD